MDQYLLLAMGDEDQKRLHAACAEYAQEEVRAGRDEDEAWERAYEMLLRPLLRQTCTRDLHMALSQIKAVREAPPASVRVLRLTIREEIKLRDKRVN